MLQRDMLLGSTVTEISDNKNAIIGSKPTEPLHFRFEKLNNKVCLSAVQTNNVGDDNGHRLKAAIEMSNMNAILQVFDISAYNNDSTAVVFDVTDFFVSDNKLMSPFDKYSVNTSGDVNVWPHFKVTNHLLIVLRLLKITYQSVVA